MGNDTLAPFHELEVDTSAHIVGCKRWLSEQSQTAVFNNLIIDVPSMTYPLFTGGTYLS
jgi:hypothetical protein